MTNMKTITMIKKLDEMIDIDMLQKELKLIQRTGFPLVLLNIHVSTFLK